MSDNVSEVSFDMNDPTVVENVLNDADLRKLPLGSDEFKAAATAKFAKTDEKPTATATEETEHDVEDTDKSDSDADKPKKKANGTQRRIDELVREREAMRRELEEVRRSVQTAQPQQEQTAQRSEPAQSTFAKAKPELTNFDNLADYTEALTDWKLEKREHEYAERAERTNVQRRATEIAHTFEQREVTVKQELDDYDDVVNVPALEGLKLAQPSLALISESEFGPRILYDMLNDDELAAKFKAAPPHRQVAMIGKLEAKYESAEPVESPSKNTAVTKAPQPAKSLPKGKAVATSKSIYDKDLSFAEYNRLMDERDRAKKAR